MFPSFGYLYKFAMFYALFFFFFLKKQKITDLKKASQPKFGNIIFFVFA